MKERLHYIDWLKGIAIISVVMGHVIQYDFFTDDCNKSFLYRFIYSIHMPLFVFLSGLVASYKFDSFNICYKKLISKVRLLLIPVMLIGIPYALWRGFSLYEFITSPMKYGYWYLLTLLELYILLYIIFVVKKITKFKYGDIYLGILIWLILKAVMHITINRDVLNCIQLTQLVVYWPFFFVAALINNYQLYDKLFSNNNLFTVSLLVFGGLFIYKEYSIVDNLIIYLMQFAGIFCIVYLVYRIRHSNNYILDKLDVIGRASLDIYIFHYFFIHVSYMKIIGSYILAYPNFIMETIITFIYSIIIVYFALYIGKLFRNSKIISKVLFNK